MIKQRKKKKNKQKQTQQQKGKKEITRADGVVGSVLSEKDPVGAVDDIAAEVGLMHRTILDEGLGRVGLVDEVEVQGVSAELVGLAHPEELHTREATHGVEAHDLHVPSEPSQELVVAREGGGGAASGVSA